MGLFSEFNAFSTRLYQLTVAVQEEALSSGSSQVEPEHVLWALRRMGHESAALLEALGVAAPPLISRADGRRPGAVGSTRAAKAAVEKYRWRNRHTDLPVLAALLGDGSTDVAALVSAQSGLDAGVLLDRVQRAWQAADAGTGRRESMAGGDRADGGQWDATLTRKVPVSPAALWAVIDEPARRPEWDVRVKSLTWAQDQAFRCSVALPGSKAGDELLFVCRERVPGRAIEWGITNGEDGSEAEILRLELLALPNGGTNLTLCSRVMADSRTPLARLVRRAAPTGLDGLAERVVQAAEASLPG